MQFFLFIFQCKVFLSFLHLNIFLFQLSNLLIQTISLCIIWLRNYLELLTYLVELRFQFFVLYRERLGNFFLPKFQYGLFESVDRRFQLLYFFILHFNLLLISFGKSFLNVWAHTESTTRQIILIQFSNGKFLTHCSKFFLELSHVAIIGFLGFFKLLSQFIHLLVPKFNLLICLKTGICEFFTKLLCLYLTLLEC